jgi:hypothetical protein
MNYNDENLLEMVELYANEVGLIASEDELSERFDNEVMPGLLEAHGKPGVQFDDEVMIDEEFSNWADSLCKGGEIHPEQYNSYEYTGKWS